RSSDLSAQYCHHALCCCDPGRALKIITKKQKNRVKTRLFKQLEQSTNNKALIKNSLFASFAGSFYHTFNRSVDQFNVGHRRAVTRTVSALQYAQITTRAL